MAKSDAYDLEAIYDSEIAPLVTQLIDICRAHQMPMFATFVYQYDPETDEDGLCTTNLPFGNERSTPVAFDKLYDVIRPARPALRLTVRNKDGAITDQTIIMP